MKRILLTILGGALAFFLFTSQARAQQLTSNIAPNAESGAQLNLNFL